MVPRWELDSIDGELIVLDGKAYRQRVWSNARNRWRWQRMLLFLCAVVPHQAEVIFVML